MKLSKPLLSHALEPNTSVYCPRCRAGMGLYASVDFAVRCAVCTLGMTLDRVVGETGSIVCYRLRKRPHETE
jgi:ribosomal protein S27E